MIKPLAISWFYENLPEEQIVEDKFKDIIKKNYSLSGFVNLDTPIIERLEVLTSKWAEDSEIYWVHRINWDNTEASLWLRFDLTVPLARYIARYEWEISFPFKRQQIARVYRWERPQKWRYREFYQADIDIIWNLDLPLFADIEIIATIYKSLKELNFWDFVININNKKFLSGFLQSIWIQDENIVKTIWIIDKKDKLRNDKLKEMYLAIWLKEEQIEKIKEFLEFWENNSSASIFEKYSKIENELALEWIKDLEYIYKNLLAIWIKEENIKINPSISRWLNYYTWLVFETFIVWYENFWSISSGGRYENLASNFTKNNFPWVGWSIGLSRLLSILKETNKLDFSKKTLTKVLVMNMWDQFLSTNLEILNFLRQNWINSEIYLDSNTKIQKQLKYANNKNIPFVLINWEDEIKKWLISLKNLESWEQKELKIENLVENIG